MINSDFLAPYEGRLSVRIKKDGEVVEERDLGKNLVVNNAKFVMAYLLGQQRTDPNFGQIIQGFDPRLTHGNEGGLRGLAPITSSFQEDPSLLRPLYMAFGTNKMISGTTEITGPAPSLTDKGLFNAINKNGLGPNTSNSVSSYFYGGANNNETVIQYLPNNEGVPNAWIRFIVTMRTNEGQPAGSNRIAYREAGLFTGMCVTVSNQAGMSGTTKCPIMIARKTFPEITKTPELELQWIWEIRF